jgi:hypothetical protein
MPNRDEEKIEGVYSLVSKGKNSQHIRAYISQRDHNSGSSLPMSRILKFDIQYKQGKSEKEETCYTL